MTFRTLPIIRHIRWVIASYAFGRWWDQVGCYLGAVPNPADLEHLDAIWRGEA